MFMYLMYLLRNKTFELELESHEPFSKLSLLIIDALGDTSASLVGCRLLI